MPFNSFKTKLILANQVPCQLQEIKLRLNVRQRFLTFVEQGTTGHPSAFVDAVSSSVRFESNRPGVV